MPSADVMNGGTSRFERPAASTQTQRDYARRLGEFDSFCSLHGPPPVDFVALEKLILMYFDEAFLCGHPLATGTKMLAAIGHRWPDLRRSANRCLLGRARRALQGWSKLCPPETWLPLPWPAVAGIACALVSMGEFGMALGVIVATDAYLRPGELLDLTTMSIIPAQTNMGPAFRQVALCLRPASSARPPRRASSTTVSPWTRTRIRGWAHCCNSGPVVVRPARRCSRSAIGSSARRSPSLPPIQASEVGG